MDTNARIEHLVQQTLDQFERPESLPPNPYLYTRIRQRLEARSERRGVLAAIEVDLARGCQRPQQWMPPASTGNAKAPALSKPERQISTEPRAALVLSACSAA